MHNTNLTAPKESTISSFEEFKQSFNPSVTVDDGYLELYANNGFSIEIDETALAMLAYAVRPEGFVDSKGRQLSVTIGDKHKKKHHLGAYSPRNHSIGVFRNGYFDDEQRQTDLRFAAKYGYMESVLSSFEINELNSTLLHELSHAADNIDKTRVQKLFSHKAMYSYAGLAIYCTTYYYGIGAFGAFFDTIATNFNDELQHSNVFEVTSVLGSVSLAAFSGSRLQSKLHKISYDTDPGELKAYGSEKVAHLLPKPIVVTQT